ncbi:uncharacterized, partial [Tachysurus ichikawai]
MIISVLLADTALLGNYGLVLWYPWRNDVGFALNSFDLVVGSGPRLFTRSPERLASCTTSVRYVSTGSTRSPGAPARARRPQPDAH